MVWVVLVREFEDVIEVFWLRKEERISPTFKYCMSRATPPTPPSESSNRYNHQTALNAKCGPTHLRNHPNLPYAFVIRIVKVDFKARFQPRWPCSTLMQGGLG